MRFFNYFPMLISIGSFFYLLYLVVTSKEGYIPATLRIIAAIIWLIIAILIYKEGKVTSKERVEKWFEKEKQKGIWYHLLYKGTIQYGITVGFLTWVYIVDFEKENNLFISFFKHIIFLLILGTFFGWRLWEENNKNARKLGIHK